MLREAVVSQTAAQLTIMQKFQRHLEIMFEGLPGHNKVAKKEYELEDATGMAVISADNWYAKVTAGARIAMSILFQLASRTKALDAQTCPRCQTINSKPNPQQGMTEWLVTPYSATRSANGKRVSRAASIAILFLA